MTLGKQLNRTVAALRWISPELKIIFSSGFT